MVLELGKDMDTFLTPGKGCSSSDVRNESASGSSSQVISRKRVGKDSSWDALPWLGSPGCLQGCLNLGRRWLLSSNGIKPLHLLWSAQ